jgi:hypothetical protein
METRLNDIDRLGWMITNYPTARILFDNCQVRYLAGHLNAEPADFTHLAIALSDARRIDFIGCTEFLDCDLAQAMKLAGVRLRSRKLGCANAAITRRPNFSVPEIEDFYRSLVALDEALYRSCTRPPNRLSKFWGLLGSARMRPAG